MERVPEEENDPRYRFHCDLDGNNVKYIWPSYAVELLVPHVSTELDAKEAIADGLRSGHVRFFVETIWDSEKTDLFGIWKPKKQRGWTFEDREAIVLSPVWLTESCQWPSDFHHWRWDSAEFVIFLSDEDDPKPLRRYLRGVHVSKVDVLKLANKTPRSGAGGPRRKEPEWNAFWHVIVELALEGRLRGFDSQTALRDEIIHTLPRGTISDATIKPVVSQLWRKVIEPFK